MTDRAEPDERFAAAYDAVGEHGRALIKTAVARLASIYSPAACTQHRSEDRFAAGFVRYGYAAPAPAALVLAAQTVRSPAALAATVAPALLAGVPEVAVARVVATEGEAADDAGWPDALLATLELVGQEWALTITPREAANVLDALAEDEAPVRVLVLGDPVSAYETAESFALAAALSEATAKGLAIRVLPEPSVLAAWMDDPAKDAGGPPLDMEAAAWAHPAAMRLAYNAGDACPDSWTPVEGGWESFIAPPATARLAPAGLVEAAFQAAPEALAMGPGNECCWVYPELDAAFFHIRSLALGPAPARESFDV